MSDSVKHKKPIHCPLFFRGHFHFISSESAIDGFCYQYKLVNYSQTIEMYSGYIESNFV